MGDQAKGVPAWRGTGELGQNRFISTEAPSQKSNAKARELCRRARKQLGGGGVPLHPPSGTNGGITAGQAAKGKSKLSHKNVDMSAGASYLHPCHG